MHEAMRVGREDSVGSASFRMIKSIDLYNIFAYGVGWIRSEGIRVQQEKLLYFDTGIQYFFLRRGIQRTTFTSCYTGWSILFEGNTKFKISGLPTHIAILGIIG